MKLKPRNPIAEVPPKLCLGGEASQNERRADNTDKKLKIGAYITDELSNNDIEEMSLEVAHK